MNQDKSLPYMVFMMKSWKNTDARPHGSTSIKPLITFPLELSLKTRFSVSMEDFHPKSRQLTKWEPLTEKWKFLTKVTFCIVSGAFCDLMWSDPENIEAWAPNNRGAGWIFGTKVVRDFNYINGIELIARAHQLVQEGFQFWFAPKNLVTIWSAPNYCYRCNNVAAIMKVSQELNKEFCIFQSVP